MNGRRVLMWMIVAAAVAAGCSAAGTDATDERARLAVTDLQPRQTVLGYAHAIVEQAQGTGENRSTSCGWRSSATTDAGRS